MCPLQPYIGQLPRKSRAAANLGCVRERGGVGGFPYILEHLAPFFNSFPHPHVPSLVGRVVENARRKRRPYFEMTHRADPPIRVVLPRVGIRWGGGDAGGLGGVGGYGCAGRGGEGREAWGGVEGWRGEGWREDCGRGGGRCRLLPVRGRGGGRARKHGREGANQGGRGGLEGGRDAAKLKNSSGDEPPLDAGNPFHVVHRRDAAIVWPWDVHEPPPRWSGHSKLEVTPPAVDVALACAASTEVVQERGGGASVSGPPRGGGWARLPAAARDMGSPPDVAVRFRVLRVEGCSDGRVRGGGGGVEGGGGGGGLDGSEDICVWGLRDI